MSLKSSPLFPAAKPKVASVTFSVLAALLEEIEMEAKEDEHVLRRKLRRANARKAETVKWAKRGYQVTPLP